MTIFLGILLTFLVFWVVVFVHELWHFLFARLFWVKVEEFGLGIPPRATKLFKDKKWTIYTLNWIPLGWFVNLKWEKFDNNITEDSDTLFSKSYFKQSIIILAGVSMNFLTAIIILAWLFYYWVEPLAINSKIKTNTTTMLIPTLDEAVRWWLLKVDWLLLEPVKWSIAEKNWIIKWDILYSINWKEINTPEEMINIIKYSDSKLFFDIKRDAWFLKIEITPIDWKIGSYVWYNILDADKNFQYKFWILDSIKYSFIEVKNQTLLTFELLWSLFKKITFPNTSYERKEAVESVWWPIALGNLFVDLVKNNVWVKVILVIWILLSINIAAFNLLPIPALDWWRFFIILVNSVIIFIFGKKALDDKVESLVHFVWFVILIILMLLIAFKDIFNIFF